ncbi:MAG TPA: methylmalonyl Co-A mutase-associated GTPase MeaB, partial [Terriglobia bacterium]|nr:methylmalonyl Co-A mutase-associated GTPase MeaB [Terriglobia bacterium]
VESREGAGIELVKLLFRRATPAYVIGVTGSPGVGKSTLVDRLAGEYRGSGSRVGIVAIDPTSPFSGGAILGDRIRMQSLAADDGIYIRSMATRGQLGGLAPASHDVVTILEAAGCQVVLIETVGVGQDEVEVARLADVTVLLLVPGLGDEVQTFKAGVMEIGDLFVVNKADHPGADRVVHEVGAMLGITPQRGAWTPPILKTVATTGEGVRALREELDRFQTFDGARGLGAERQRAKWRSRLLGLLRETLFEQVVAQELSEGVLDRAVEDVRQRRRDPRTVVEELAGRHLGSRAGTEAAAPSS